MAQFHAVPIALKLQQPETFEKKVKKYLACFHPLPPEFVCPEAEQTILDILSECEYCLPTIPKFKKWYKHAFDITTEFTEPFATVVHRDMWINNFMVKLDGDLIAKNKFVDFQLYSYDAPVKDLLFFLFTSVQVDVLKTNLDYLLKHYHKHFLHTLMELNCPITDFSYDKFMEQIKLYGGFEVGHIIYMLLFVVCAKKEMLPDLDTDPGYIPKEKLLPEAKERSRWILQEFEKRKWMEINELCT